MQEKLRMNLPQLTIIVPTFNEVQNIDIVVKKLEETLSSLDFEIIFVDDNSDDGTADAVRNLEEQKPFVSLLLRVGRRGLAGACIEGMIAAKSSLVAVMDCDLQHDETKLLAMFSKFKHDQSLDLVVGSRHSDEGQANGGLSLLSN